MPESTTPDADLPQELAHIKDALALLGARPCCNCGKFYLTADAGNLFNSGTDRVCYNCIAPWWRARCPTLTVPERQSIEPKLMRWLIEHHQAKVFRQLNDLPPEAVQDIHLTLGCAECGGTGILAGGRCHHCLGNRNIWVITFKKPSAD
ncbi:MAG: hypothetical protein ABR971_15820 [Acidobacteriaceae bacterium]|jgi:hypothetical protein